MYFVLYTAKYISIIIIITTLLVYIQYSYIIKYMKINYNYDNYLNKLSKIILISKNVKESSKGTELTYFISKLK